MIQRNTSINKVIGSVWFFWVLLLVGSGVYLSIGAFVADGIVQEALKMVVLFSVIFGFIRNGQIRKECKKQQGEEKSKQTQS